ncbi:MAG: DNA recombination protein RmuC [Terriglobales bacterium]
MSGLAALVGILAGVAAGVALTWWIVHRTRQELQAQLAAVLPGVTEAILGQKTAELKQAGAETQADFRARMEEMRRQLEAYQTRITEFEKERAGAQAKIEQQLLQVAGAGAAMAQEARSLREALTTSSGVRGAWGESVLQNIFNTCGLNEQIDYDLQVVLPGGLRPDAVLYLATGRKLVVDVKASLSDFLAGLEAADDAQRRACFSTFAKVLRERARELARKDYVASLERSLPFVAMFVPSESAFRAALDADPELFLYGQTLQPPVLLASPSTLFPLVATVAQGWQQFKAGQQMQKLLDEVAELGSRLLLFHKHLQGVGKAIDDAAKAFNSTAASYRSRLSPQLLRLQELNANWNPPLDLKNVETRPQLADSTPD